MLNSTAPNQVLNGRPAPVIRALDDSFIQHEVVPFVIKAPPLPAPVQTTLKVTFQ